MMDSALELEGGVEAVAGLEAPAHAPRTVTGGVREAEGGLRWRSGAFDSRLELDAAGGIGPGGVWVGSLVPQYFGTTAHGPKAWLGVGIAPGPWRVEAVDGWDNALITFSDVQDLVPRSMAQAQLGVGTPERGVSLRAGLDLGAGLDLVHDPATQLDTAPVLYGIRGDYDGDTFRLGGGVVSDMRTSATAEGDARVQLDAFGLQGMLLVESLVGPSATLQADWKAGPVTPAVRVGIARGGIDADAGVRWDPAEWATLKAEVGWDDWALATPGEGTLAAWISAAVYTPAPHPLRKGR